MERFSAFFFLVCIGWICTVTAKNKGENDLINEILDALSHPKRYSDFIGIMNDKGTAKDNRNIYSGSDVRGGSYNADDLRGAKDKGTFRDVNADEEEESLARAVKAFLQAKRFTLDDPIRGTEGTTKPPTTPPQTPPPTTQPTPSTTKYDPFRSYFIRLCSHFWFSRFPLCRKYIR